MEIAIITKSGEKREEKLKEFLKEELLEYGIQTIDANTVQEALEEADQIIIAFDAKLGMNPEFAETARVLYKHNVHPILLITNSDVEGADNAQAKMAMGEIWTMENPDLSSEELFFSTFYFSYEKMMLDTVEEVKEDSIEVLVKIICKD